MNKIIEKITKTRILAAIGLGCAFLGIIFPYAKSKILILEANISLWSCWEGKIMVLLLLVNLIIIFKDYVKKYIPKLYDNNIGKKILELDNIKVSLIPTTILIFLALLSFSGLNLNSSYVTLQLGCFLFWLGAISLASFGFLYKSNITIKNEVVNNTPKNVLETMTDSPNNIEVSKPKNNVIYCPNCGHKNENTKKCNICGKEFN